MGVPLADEDEIDHNKSDTFSPWLPKVTTTSPLSLINIDPEADIDLQQNLRTLCAEFSDFFINELPAEAATVPPFYLIVDTMKWKSPRNRAPPRPQSAPKQAESIKTLDTLKRQGISSLLF